MTLCFRTISKRNACQHGKQDEQLHSATREKVLHIFRGKVKSPFQLTLKVLVTTIDAQWEGMGDVGSARYKLALLPPCPTIRVLSYSN